MWAKHVCDLALAVRRMWASIGNDLDGLGQSAVDCLTNLTKSADGTLTIKEIAELGDISPETAARTVTELVDSNLVVRVLPREGEDRRRRRVQITGTARQMIIGYYALQPHNLEWFDQFSDEELAIAAKVFSVVTRIAHDRASSIQTGRGSDSENDVG
ncbi:hypothetical protein Lesp02_76960 [Lentzea sp. NBRC 105346]|nr:hypothetical protein Lesp02_76960 [Lentzea sp. NBRC 105346]